jgi:D-alanine-D-alanine ligase
LKKSKQDKENDSQDLEPEPADNEAEYDDITTVLAIRAALEARRCRVTLLEVNEQLPAKLMEDKPDIVFNIAEGIRGRGRESQVPALLDFYEIPYTGSDETTLCIALDKALTKRILSTYRIKTPKYQIINKEQTKLTAVFLFPQL